MVVQAHASLAEALTAFQAEVPKLPKDATNPHFRSKFTPLDTMVELTTPLLVKHGLSWSALPCFGPNGEPALRYQLSHGASGQELGSMMPLLVTKNDPQGMGSALTYARRYSLAAVLNLVSDDDDDGNRAQRQEQAPPFGKPFDRATLMKTLGPACTRLAGGQGSRGRALFEQIADDCGGYMPEAAAIALIHAADGLGWVGDDVEAPEVQ